MTAPTRRVSARLAAIAPSATLAVDSKAKALKAAGRPVIGFGAGEPDFPTPAAIVDAAVAAAKDPRNHRYTPAAGLPELKQAIATKTLRDSGYEIDPASIIVTNGGKQAVFQAFAAIIDPGDEVLLPAPYWTTYPEAISLAGGEVGRGVCGSRPGVPGHGRPTGGRAHRRDQGSSVLLALEPDRRRLLTRADQGDRRVGPRARHLGHHGRDLRAPHVRRRGVHADAPRRAGTRRPDHRAQRRRQDVRNDRLARRLDDRPSRRRQGGVELPVSSHLERGERVAASRHRSARGRTRRRSPHAQGFRPQAHGHGRDASRH